MKPIQDPDGSWRVEDATGTVRASGLTNAEAWRFIDRAQNDPINRSEAAHDWSFRQMANKQ